MPGYHLLGGPYKSIDAGVPPGYHLTMPHKDPDARRAWRREYRKKWRSNRGRSGVVTRRGGLRASRPCPGVCEVCGSPSESGRRLDFDHCPLTDKFRGWLCNPCNMTLGCAKDNTDRLLKLAAYIERFYKRP